MKYVDSDEVAFALAYELFRRIRPALGYHLLMKIERNRYGNSVISCNWLFKNQPQDFKYEVLPDKASYLIQDLLYVRETARLIASEILESVKL